MRDTGRRDSLQKRLSQLLILFQKSSLSIKKSISGILFVSVSFFGVFPALPEIDPVTFAVSEKEGEAVAVTKEISKEEECLWKKDVILFNSLEQKGKSVKQMEVPCGEEKAALVSVTIDQNDAAQTSNPGLNQTIREMAHGYPLEEMASAIASYDREIAALIVGIAKKESNWGKRVPRTPDGADCFNYWGYKGAGTRGVAMGHGCFGSPEEAVKVIGDRLTVLVEKRKTSEPKNMIIWKCGSSCATHSPESVRKWISDVDLYYQKIAKAN